MTESDILRALGEYCRKRKFRFFAHVKDGSYYGRQQRILDGFAVKDRQFINLFTEGFEVKVSRSDFLRDVKWQEYLPVCSSFYFVVPENMVGPHELPEGIGLIFCNERGALTIIKKARRRELDQPKLFEVFKYLVFNRTYSETEKVKAAVRKVRKLESKAAEDERTIKNWRDSYYDVQNELYALKRGRPAMAVPEGYQL
ncbi:MmcB family DNA repair protein [Anaeroselena agilis]|uniref:MmcB family DNA repair protein n=1 Tax=Anaeroselena agilis TaxID=3063788 RepID=A0ABU3P2B4_9FIRM|nr:MmcB family DNA repair protein [Selenomonadales bacterium 4137-cl]